MELGVDRHVEVHGDGEAGAGADDLGVLARAHEDAGDDLAIVLPRWPRRRRRRRVRTSLGASQLMIAPSASRPARRSIPSRRAATRIGGDCSGRTPRRKPRTSKVSYVADTFSPDSASRRKRTTSRTFLYGSTNGMPFHRSTMTLLDEPMPMAKRPGAASASEATHWARQAGARVNAGTIAVPEAQPRLPRGGERQRREGVGGVGLGGPDVGVPEVGELGEPLAVGVQRTRQRHGHSRPHRRRHIGVVRRHHRCLADVPTARRLARRPPGARLPFAVQCMSR